MVWEDNGKTSADTDSMSADKQGDEPAGSATAAVNPKPQRPAAAPATAKPAATSRKSGSGFGLLLILLLVLVLAAATGAMGYYGWQWQQQQLQAQQELQVQLEQLQDLRQLPGRLQTLQTQLDSVNSGVSIEQWRETGAAVASISRVIKQQQSLLSSLATTTRSDWQLAEAEYLLRLANQRLLMEHSATGALALLESADDILQELDDMQLYVVRQQLARDIAALKLVDPVDRSGIFLRLAALSEQVLRLPTNVRPRTPYHTDATAAAESSADIGLWQKLRHNFFAAMKKLGDQVRIRRHDEPVEPLLPPDAESYLRQNVSFNLEQAQLALLREETAIYRNSLQRARSLLQKHFNKESRAQTIAVELAQLAVVEVQVALPDITGSLQALQDFNTQLHKLEPASDSPQLNRPAEVQ